MALRRRWGKILRGTSAALLALVAGLALFVQIEQRVLRSRAERLLTDMRAMQSHPGSWTDAQKLMRRWRPWGLGESSCTTEQCFFYVRIVDPVHAILIGKGDRPSRLHWLIWPAQLLGEKFAFIEASLRVNHGIVEESRFRMNFWGQDEGMERSVETFSIWDSFRAERLQHPDYYAESYPGCEGCNRFETAFTPFAGRDKIRELTDFNFSCITRWRPCTTEADLMPAAWKIYEEELPKKASFQRAFDKCRVPPEALGRENHTIAIVNVISSQGPVRSGNRNLWSARLQVIRDLKGRLPWPQSRVLKASNEIRDNEIFWAGSPALVAGKRYIVLGYLTETGTGRDLLDLDSCGIIPYSDQNLISIQRGIDAALLRHIPQRLGVDSIWP